MNDDYFFKSGYSELYLYKFKKYLSGVGKALQDQRLKNHPYRYDEVNCMDCTNKFYKEKKE